MKDLEQMSVEFQVIESVTSGNPYFLMDLDFGPVTKQLTFRLVKKEKEKAVMKVVIQPDGEAISLPGLPFGGIWIPGQIQSEELQFFVLQTIKELQCRNCTALKIIQPPKPYEKYSDLIGNILFKKGFSPEIVQSHQFYLGKKKLKSEVKSFSDKNRKSLHSLNLTVKKGPVLNFNFLDEIRNWNSEKGYSTLFDEKKLIYQVAEFPERYFQISLFRENEAVAHCLAVKLVTNSFYYYLSAIRPNSHIPNGGDLVLQSLFQLAAEQKTEFIDLGSSEVESAINSSLMFFKARFSNDVSNKVTWTRRFFYE